MAFYRLAFPLNNNISLNSIIEVFVKFLQDFIIETEDLFIVKDKEVFTRNENLYNKLIEDLRKILIAKVDNIYSNSWLTQIGYSTSLESSSAKTIGAIISDEPLEYTPSIIIDGLSASCCFEQVFNWSLELDSNNLSRGWPNELHFITLQLNSLQFMPLIAIIHDLLRINRKNIPHINSHGIATTQWTINNQVRSLSWPLPTFSTFLELTHFLQHWNEKLNKIEVKTDFIASTEIMFFYIIATEVSLMDDNPIIGLKNSQVENKDWIDLKKRLIRLINRFLKEPSNSILRDQLINIILLFMPEFGVSKSLKGRSAFNDFFAEANFKKFCKREAERIQSHRNQKLQQLDKEYFLTLRKKLYLDSISVFGQELTSILWPQNIIIEINSPDAEEK